MDLKGKISYCLISLGAFSMLLCLLCAGSGSNSRMSVYLLFTSIFLWVIGFPLYAAGYEKVIVVKEIKCIVDIDKVSGQYLYSDYRVYDDNGIEYKCSILLHDMLSVGDTYRVKISYNGEIFRVID